MSVSRRGKKGSVGFHVLHRNCCVDNLIGYMFIAVSKTQVQGCLHYYYALHLHPLLYQPSYLNWRYTIILCLGEFSRNMSLAHIRTRAEISVLPMLNFMRRCGWKDVKREITLLLFCFVHWRNCIPTPAELHSRQFWLGVTSAFRITNRMELLYNSMTLCIFLMT